MTYSELKKFLKKNGCYKDHDGANHEMWYSPKTKRLFPIGRHNKDEVPDGTLHSIKKDAGVK